MDILNKIILWLDSYVDKPPLYGLYHLSWVFGLIIACIVFAFLSKKYNKEKLCKTTLLICWILLIVLEIIKEFLRGYSIDGNNKIHFSYNFMYFPYQLCSLPFYVLPFIIFIKDYKIKKYFVSATVSFILLGGMLFVLFPGGLKNNLYLNFHTMIHHTLQVFTSFVCIIWYQDKMSFREFFNSIIPISVGMVSAILMNVILYKITDVSVQFWNLSPYVVFDMEILEKIRGAIGYIPYVIVYFILLSILSFIVYMVPVLFKKKQTVEE